MHRYTTRVDTIMVYLAPTKEKHLTTQCMLALLVCFFACQFLLPQKAFSAAGEAPTMPESMMNMQSQTGNDITNSIAVTPNGSATYNGQKVNVRQSLNNDVGFALPDGRGNLVWAPVPAPTQPNGQVDARELKLKIRELADQLISGMGNNALRGALALPTSFVNQDDFTQSSSLGRYVAEQLYFEFNQRGFPVREYRMGGAVRITENGEMLLSRTPASIPAQDPNLLFVVGTYYLDKQAVFMNARLIRGSDGHVLRSAQLILPANGLTRRMLAGSGKTLKAGTMGIQDFKTVTQPTNLTPIDRGEDIH